MTDRGKQLVQSGYLTQLDDEYNVFGEITPEEILEEGTTDIESGDTPETERVVVKYREEGIGMEDFNGWTEYEVVGVYGVNGLDHITVTHEYQAAPMVGEGMQYTYDGDDMNAVALWIS